MRRSLSTLTAALCCVAGAPAVPALPTPPNGLHPVTTRPSSSRHSTLAPAGHHVVPRPVALMPTA